MKRRFVTRLMLPIRLMFTLDKVKLCPLNDLNRDMRKLTMWFLTRSYTNWAVQPKKT